MSQQCLWTRQQKLQFVQEYVKHKSLLITGHMNETKNRKLLRQAALIQISKHMNLPGFGPREAYKKLRNIKSTYAQELKKIRNASSRGNKYVSNLIWFNTLHNALDAFNREDHTYTKPSENNECIDLTDNPEANSIKDEICEEEDTATIASNYLKEEEQISIDRENPRKIKVPLYGIQNYANSLTDTADNNDNNMSNNNDSCDATSDLLVTHMRNEFDVFGESIGAQLKNMPLTDALEAQIHIQSYLSSLRLQGLRRQIP